MRTRHILARAAIAVLLAPIALFGVVLLIPAALLLVLGLPLLGASGATALAASVPRTHEFNGRTTPHVPVTFGQAAL